MIRFTLRQFRASGVLALGALTAFAVVLLVTGPHLVHLYDTVVAKCSTQGDCSSVTSSFLANDRALQIGGNAAVVILPCLLGLFWGAPLIAHELESGTYRLAWTQGVTRRRWLVLKLAILGAASMATAGLLSLMVTWWSSPIDRANMDIFTSFDQRDIVPIGYAAFAFMLGVTGGIVIRRTLPAMATTLVTFVVARLAINQWIRPHLLTPVTLTSTIDSGSIGFDSVNGGPITVQAGGPNIPNAWIYSSQFVNKAGQVVSPATATKSCPGIGQGPGVKILPGSSRHSAPAPANIQSALQACGNKLNETYHLLTTYQPASHYWPMQWIELGIYLALALGLAGLCNWWVRHRIA
jgi:ABC-type transport system involved in multi-copper enzyme maturation permease subunit